MNERILLVTASRALGDTPAAFEWARCEVERVCAEFDPATVVAGDARGGDEAARRVADVQGRVFERWCLDEWARSFQCGELMARRRWWPPGVPRLPPERMPLSRNLAMTASVVRRVCLGATAVVLSLRAPWSEKNGTRHTVERAREMGLAAPEPLVCPAEHSPESR